MVEQLVQQGRRGAQRIAHDAAHRGVRWAARRLRYEVLWPSYYNGIPRLDELPPGFWSRRSSTPAVSLNEEAALRYLEGELREHLAAFAPGTAAEPGRYHVPNGSYDEFDGALLWAMLRRHRPRRVLELGSGYSSLLIRDALDANASDGPRAQHIVIDPFPRASELGEIDGTFELRRMSAAGVPPAEFEALADGDLLFVDTTHTVKVGSEVNHVILDALPLLAPGVLVQVHDIFLPWEYPRHLIEGLGYHWAEQYLLQAFLAFNDAFEVLAPAHLLVREHRDAIDRLLPMPPREASAFWMRRTRQPARRAER